MKKYFTSFDLEDNKYKGTIYDSTTNQILYTTGLHDSLAQATAEVNENISKLQPNTAKTTTPINNPSPTTFKKRTCCGN